MKTFFIWLLMAFLAGSPAAAQTASLYVRMDDIKNDQGKVQVGLLNDQGKQVVNQSLHAQQGRLSCQFNNLTPGPYFVRILHDENSNQVLDKNSMGIPQEGYGFSNNPNSRFGPPKPDQMLISVAGTDSIVVKMRYYW